MFLHISENVHIDTRYSFFFFGFVSLCYGAVSGGRGRILEAYVSPPTPFMNDRQCNYVCAVVAALAVPSPRSATPRAQSAVPASVSSLRITIRGGPEAGSVPLPPIFFPTAEAQELYITVQRHLTRVLIPRERLVIPSSDCPPLPRALASHFSVFQYISVNAGAFGLVLVIRINFEMWI